MVTVNLDAAQQTEVTAGDQVTITLPGGQTTPGVVSSVGKVATQPSPGTSGSTPTIIVKVTATDPKAAGGLDQAPVQVSITTGRVSNALVVPVTALLAQAGGGYAVEVAGPRGNHLVAVSPGMFDSADGLVQVTGSGLSAGQHVVVPTI
jgi:multidrug efflux pump subunit AcrA (membrane-fusion protein)